MMRGPKPPRIALGSALGLVLLGGCERAAATVDPASAADRDLEIVLPPRWAVEHTASRPIETHGFRLGPELARSVHRTGLAELELRDVWADERIAILAHDTGEPAVVELSADARRLALALADGSVDLWDAEVGRRLARLGRLPRIVSMWFSEDGRILLVATEDGLCRIWDGRSGRPLQTLGPFGRRVEARPSPDGRRVVVQEEEGATLWDVDTGRRVRSLDVAGFDIDQIRFSPDGRVFAGAHERGAAVWRSEDGERLGIAVAPQRPEEERHPHDHAFVHEVYWSPGGKWVAFSWIGAGDWLTVHEARSGRQVWREPVDADEVAFAWDEASFAFGSRYTFSWIDLPSGELRSKGFGDLGVLVFRKTEPALVVGLRGDDPLQLEGAPVAQWRSDQTVRARATSDGRHLVGNERSPSLGRSFGDPLITDAETLETLRSTGRQSIAGVRFSGDQRHLITAGHHVTVWDAAELSPRIECPVVDGMQWGHEGGLAVIDGGRTVVVQSRVGLHVFDWGAKGCTLRATYEDLTGYSEAWLELVRPNATELLVPYYDQETYNTALRSLAGEPPFEMDRMHTFERFVADPSGEMLIGSDYQGEVSALTLDGKRWSVSPHGEVDRRDLEVDLSLLAIAPERDGPRVVTLDNQLDLRVIDPLAGAHRVLHRFEPTETYGHRHHLAFAGHEVVLVLREDELLAFSAGGAAGQGPLAQIEGVQAFAVHPDGERVVLSVSGGCDPGPYGSCRGTASLRFVTTSDLRELSSVRLQGYGLADFAFTADGRTLAATGGGALWLLSAPAGDHGPPPA